MALTHLKCLYPPKELKNESLAIRHYMQQLLTNYNKLRTSSSDSSCPLLFWDLVAISSRDEKQKLVYELQIEEKLNANELPKIPYVVFSDPENGKIGNGGSTLHVLEQLHSQFGDALLEMRILLIHAGGSSQRLTTASILGKLFTPLPVGEPPYQMLDLKLAIYLPFLKRMTPGVMVTCSDDIETYWFEESDNDSTESVWSFEERGFVALAHKGDVETGTHHGVYVLPFVDFDIRAAVTFGMCLQVLQKPSVEVMDLKGAIIDGFGVCTDSVFYFSKDVIRKFLDFYKTVKPIDCEIDAYNDFLQALGLNANMDYIHNARNKLTASKSLTHLRQKLYLLLHKTPLNVLLLHWSRFHHLGTCQEYIEHLTDNRIRKDNLFHDLGFSNWWRSRLIDVDCGQSNGNAENVTSLTVVHSILRNVDSKGPAVVEYCNFRSGLTIGEFCLISYCTVLAETPLVIPARSCIHSIPVRISGNLGHVTVAFGVDDDLKASYETFESGEMLYFGKKISDALPFLQARTVVELFDERIDGCCSLWNAKLFPVKENPTESFLSTLRQVLQIRGETEPIKKLPIHENDENVTMLSMAEVIAFSDVKTMLQMRKSLIKEITDK